MAFIAVKGMRDIIGSEADGFAYIENVFKSVCYLYGYSEYRVPSLEYTEVFSRSTGEGSDVVRKEMYTFQDKGGRSVTLRPEFTAGVARAVVEKKLYATEDLPIKAFYYGPVFRYERPQLGRYRQFEQAGVECIGEDSARYDAETIALAVTILSCLGFEGIHLKVNSLGDEASRAAYREALKQYFSAHIDEMCEDCHERLQLNPLRILDCKVEHDQEIAKGAPKMKDYLSPESEKRFDQTLSILNDLDIDYENDDELVRGLDYYGEIVFEVHATSKTGQDYGALLGGGHYGGLLKALGGPEMAGVGFAFGLDRVYNVMKDNGLHADIEKPSLDVYVIPVGDKVLDEAFEITEIVRGLGYSAETPMKSGKLGTFFKKADRKGARFALILGEDELSRGVAQLKDMKSQTQKEIQLDSLEDELDAVLGEEDEEHEHDHECECCHDKETESQKKED